MSESSPTRNSVSIQRSPSAASVGETQDASPSKHKKNGLTLKLTKLTLFGRKRSKDHQLARDQLNEYLQQQEQAPVNSDLDDISSVCEEEGAPILWEEDGNVKACTPIMLVRRITDEKFVDSNLVTDVIVSYRCFTTPAIFLELLVRRFDASPPIGLRVCAVLKSWIERQWSDFDTALADSLMSFIKNTIQTKDIFKNVAEQLLKLVAKKQSPEGNRPAALSNPPVPPQPLLPLALDEISGNGTLRAHDLNNFGPDVTFWSFPTKEIARQLTIIEFKLYSKIEYVELIAQAWAKPNSDVKAPNVLAVINHFNKVSAWVCSEIVSTHDLQQRIERVLQLIDIAQHFFTMNNFNGLMAVLAGLHSSSVHRLKRTWAAVQDKSKETFVNLTEFMSSAKNYTQYREHLQKVALPALPYLGVFLSDLTFIEEGNPGEIGTLVNFSKCRQIAAVIRKIADFQAVPFTLVSIPFVQNYFNNFTTIDDKDAYECSTKLEPRAMSTHVTSFSTSTLASSAIMSLTSSVGIDREYELADSELGEEQPLDMHLRFKKDLIRSRNNSLNSAGEPFPIKVQLPGSLPVEMRMPPTTTSRQAVKHFADFFSGLNEQYCLVIMPCREDAKGFIFADDTIVKDVLNMREKEKANMKLALFASPVLVSCALFLGSTLGDSKEILVDLGVPLFSLFALFQDTLNTSEEIAYLAYDKTAKKAWWLNMHKSLEENQFQKSGTILVIFPLSNLSHKSVESLMGGDKQGPLLSGGREGTLKVATVRQLWAILSGPFLLCFKNKHDSSPFDVIVLDRYSVQLSTGKHVSVLLDRNPIFPVNGPCKAHYSFAADTDSETRAWVRACQRNRGLLGDKIIFGEELDRCAKTSIPAVVQKTVNFIYSNALQVEGLFKPQTNSSLVQHFKNQFDQGVEVEFTRTNDACTVAQLLLLYFEELPNPLLSYDLFPKLVEFGLKPPSNPDDEVNVLRDIISQLSSPHLTVLAYLLAFLSQVSAENPIKAGIASIFGPCLMRPSPQDSEPKNYKEITKTVLGKLIKHREKIFTGISRKQDSLGVADPKSPPSSSSPNNNNPHCRELAVLFDKQLQNNAAIAKRVELLKSQLENKYKENKYKTSHLKRQVSLHEDIQNSKPTRTRSSPYRNHKSVSFVTRPTFNEPEEEDDDGDDDDDPAQQQSPPLQSSKSAPS